MRRSLYSLCLILLCAAGASPAQVFNYLAFGDSITEGFNDNPLCLGCANRVTCGYRPRLSGLLGCDGSNCAIVNHGLSGERTFGGITRLNQILAGNPNWDVMILKEGSNDVYFSIPNVTIRNNLGIMANNAAALGIDTVHASTIRYHPFGDWGTGKDALILDLRNRVETLAANNNRYFADPWSVLCPNGACFNSDYCEDNPFGATLAEQWVLGHPGPAGFDTLAEELRATIEQQPAPTPPTQTAPSGESNVTPTLSWTKESPDRANWYQLQVEDPSTTTVLDEWVKENDVCVGTTCTFAVVSALGAGDHTWKIRGRNPKGRSAFGETAFTVYTTLPAAVSTLTAPAGDMCVATPYGPTYTWVEAADATHYRLRVDGPTGMVIDQIFDAASICGAGTCSATPATGLLPGAHGWKVQSQNPAGNASFSPPLAFGVIRSPLPPPAGRYPSGDLLIFAPTYEWTQVAGAADYTLGGTIPATSTAGFFCDGSICSVQPAAPVLTLGNHTWTVTPSNACTTGGASPAVAFSVIACSPTNLDLENETVNGTQVKNVCDTIRAGNLGAGDYVVGATGDLTLHAGVDIELANGVAILTGGVFVVIVDR